MLKRINFILNGVQDFKCVIKNLKKIFTDTTLIYTYENEDCVRSAIEKEFNYADKMNDVKIMDIGSIADCGELEQYKIIVVTFPQNTFSTAGCAINHAFRFINTNNLCEYVHVFMDDVVIVSDNYSPEDYEYYMDTFDEPFLMDSKTNPFNFVFKKYSPIFVFNSKKLKNPISFVRFEAKEHFIVNRLKFDCVLNENIKRMYITELVARVINNKIIKNGGFFADPIVETWVKRDMSLPFSKNYKQLQNEYMKDNDYMLNELKIKREGGVSIDEIIERISKIVEKI